MRTYTSRAFDLKRVGKSWLQVTLTCYSDSIHYDFDDDVLISGIMGRMVCVGTEPKILFRR